jgi:hypothetical protein
MKTIKAHDLAEFVNPHPIDFNEMYRERKLPGNYEIDRLWYDRKVLRDMRSSLAHYERRVLQEPMDAMRFFEIWQPPKKPWGSNDNREIERILAPRPTGEAQ